MKPKYKLTILQWASLPFRWLIWICLDKKKRKSWHLLKKGMEHHEHKFVKYHFYGGRPFLKCGHEGCMECKPYLKSMVKGIPKSGVDIAFKKAASNDSWKRFKSAIQKQHQNGKG